MFGVLNQILEFFRFFFVYNGYPSFKVGSDIFWIDIALYPPHIAFYNRSLVFDPKSLRVLVCLNVTCFMMRDIVPNHLLLILIGAILQSLLEVVVAFY